MRSTAVVTAIAAVAALLLPGVATATEPEPEPAVPALEWADCGDGFQCATAAVPLDHDEPDGPTIDLALIRKPATDPAARVGSLFTNPGGPGGSGVEFVRLASAVFPADVQARFDIIGLDPRGVGGSTPLRCFADPAEQLAFFTTVSPSPSTPEQEEATEAASIELGRRCAERNPDIASHLSTADVARDLHLLMQAVGDEALNYYGVSYGTYLGATFAALFPDDVRTLVLDGVVEPNTYTGGDDVPTFVRERSNVGSSETLDRFLDLCAEVGDTQCAFAAGGDPQAKFAELADGLREQPLTVPLPDGGSAQVDFGVFITTVINILYADVAWPLLAVSLQDLYTGSPATMSDLMSVLQGPETLEYNNAPEALRAIVCADTANPDDPSAWPELAADADADTPYVGAYWAYISQPCAAWPVETEDAYAGPFDAETAGPALVVGTRFDPATPYSNAEALADALPGARLLTLDGVGHTSFGQGACVGGEVSKYLVTGEVPAEGTTCFPDRQPFDPLPDAPGIPPERAAAVMPVWSAGQ